jgi:hypothetical protein
MADSSFTTYESVLSHYPFLSGRSLGPQEMGDMPNLKRLKMQAAARRITDNSLENVRICQFEVPGGGECRDTACADVHLSQLEVEPKGAPRPVTCPYSAMSRSYRLDGVGCGDWLFVYR